MIFFVEEDGALFSKSVGFLFDAKHVCNDKSKVIATLWVLDIWEMADNADTGENWSVNR